LPRIFFFHNPCRSVTSVPIRGLFGNKPRIATDHTDEHGCLYSFVPIRHIRTDPGALWDVTSLQKRTAETPRAQRTQKRTVTDAWRSVRGHDALWNPSLRTLRLCGDIPFCSGLNHNYKLWIATDVFLIRADPSHPCRSVVYSYRADKAHQSAPLLRRMLLYTMTVF
jgi:hypothetical protein